VAINDDLVADLSMEEIVKRVVGPEGSEVTIWLERSNFGGESFCHHEKEKAEDIRAQLSKLRNLRKDGLLDERAYRAGVGQCWKGCYSVTVRRGVTYKGGIDVSVPMRPSSYDFKNVLLTFWRASTNEEFDVILPRPTPTDVMLNSGSASSTSVGTPRRHYTNPTGPGTATATATAATSQKTTNGSTPAHAAAKPTAPAANKKVMDKDEPGNSSAPNLANGAKLQGNAAPVKKPQEGGQGGGGLPAGGRDGGKDDKEKTIDSACVQAFVFVPCLRGYTSTEQL
jgi:hypothetical protein